MKNNSVMIKSCAYGLNIFLDGEIPFPELLLHVAEKFREAARFFQNAQMAVSFKGRVLTEEEELQLVSTITQNSRIHIVCLVDESKESADHYKEAVVKALEQNADEKAQIHHGTLVSGDRLETESSVLILGDVKPGASVTSAGNVIILGRCMGQVCAGVSGREDVFAAALMFKPSMIRIAGLAARPAIQKSVDTGEYKTDPMIAFIKDGHIVTERISASVLSMIENLNRGKECLDSIN